MRLMAPWISDTGSLKFLWNALIMQTYVSQLRQLRWVLEYYVFAVAIDNRCKNCNIMDIKNMYHEVLATKSIYQSDLCSRIG